MVKMMKSAHTLLVTSIGALAASTLLATSILPAQASTRQPDAAHSHQAKHLDIQTFNPTTNGIFPITSTLITGDKDAILVDAQFQPANARKVVDLIKQSGKHLKAIFISYNDPDYYFGLQVLKKAFPDTPILSTPETAYLINASKDQKLQEWKKALGDDAPTQLITPTAYNRDSLELDGQRIDIIKHRKDPQHSFLWIPSTRTVVGGGEFQQGQHIWLADTQDVKGIDKWVHRLDVIETLHPKQIIPAHYVKADYSPAVLEADRTYLQRFKAAFEKQGSTVDSIVKAMKDAYPTYGDTSSLEMSAKVFKHEAEWKVYAPYPPLGSAATLTAGKQHFRLVFNDDKVVDVHAGHHTVYRAPFSVVENTPETFTLSWSDPKTGTHYSSEQHWDSHNAVTTIETKGKPGVKVNGTIHLGQ